MHLLTPWALLLILPLTLLVYWRVARGPRGRQAVLLTASWIFCLPAAAGTVPLLLGLSVVTFLLARRGWMLAGILLNLAVLGVFKLWTAGDATTAAPPDTVAGWIAFAVPLGLSYYTFKHVGYLVDVRQGRYPAGSDALRFLTFSSLFPQLTAGPISSYGDTGAQLANPPQQLPAAMAHAGLVRLSLGLAKKLLIADVLATPLTAALHGSATPELGFAGSWVTLAVLALQIYFDFSGYTDIALGIALLFGITLPPNFDNPFRAANPREFWERWHMSLVTWLRAYLFLPLSRALLRHGRGPRVAREIATMTTMLVLGLWHGVTWGFVLWGVYNGLLLTLHSWWQRHDLRLGSAAAARALLVVSVVLGVAFFASPDLSFLGGLLSALSGARGLALERLPELFGPREAATAVVAAGLALTGVADPASPMPAKGRRWAVLAGVLAALALTRLGEAVEILYARF